MANIRFSFFAGVFILSCFVVGEVAYPQEGQKAESVQALEEYEKEKLAKLKQNIGKRYLVIRTVRPVEFYRSPEEEGKKFIVQKEKEGFLITEVVQNRSGTMNFYHVVFDSGEIGYLSADGNYLGLKILEKSIILLSRAGAKGGDSGAMRGSSSKAVELVKKHHIRVNPMSGDRLSVESRMVEARTRFFPNLKWRYEAREIGHGRVRVIQFSEGEGSGNILRTWIVNSSTQAVQPENQSAQSLYQ